MFLAVLSIPISAALFGTLSSWWMSRFKLIQPSSWGTPTNILDNITFFTSSMMFQISIWFIFYVLSYAMSGQSDGIDGKNFLLSFFVLQAVLLTFIYMNDKIKTKQPWLFGLFIIIAVCTLLPLILIEIMPTTTVEDVAKVIILGYPIMLVIRFVFRAQNKNN